MVLLKPWKEWGVTRKEWNSWKWQIENRITSLEKLEQHVNLTENEKIGVSEVLKKFRMAITPYYASLIDPYDENCPIRLQAIPRKEETLISKFDLKDPLGEVRDSKNECIVHRYPDRVLFLVTDKCGMYCRHCTRRRMVGQTDAHKSEKAIKEGIKYIKRNEKIKDVLISGGDPFVMENDELEEIIEDVYKIPHVEIIRLGTTTPVTLPQRITRKLTRMLRKYHPLYVNTHFNHPKEFTPNSERAVKRLVDAGIPVGNQTVLLRRVNDCKNVMRELVYKLIKNRIRPYYIYQCDLSEGIEHFRTKVDVGIEIIESLRGHISGLAIPTYVIDAPGGGGKIPITPNYLLTKKDGKVIIRNFKWEIAEYPEPNYEKFKCNCEFCRKENAEEKN